MGMEIEISEICRLCASGRKAIQLSSLPGDNAPSYYEIVSILTALVENSNNLPNGICDDCAIKLIFIWEFKIKVEKSQEQLNEILANKNPEKSADLSATIDGNSSNSRELLEIEIEKSIKKENTNDFDDNSNSTTYLDESTSCVDTILNDKSENIVSSPRAETSVKLNQATNGEKLNKTDDTNTKKNSLSNFLEKSLKPEQRGKNLKSIKKDIEKNCRPYTLDNTRDAYIDETALAVRQILNEETIKEHYTEHAENHKEIKESILDNKTNEKKKFNVDAFIKKNSKVRNKAENNQKLKEIIDLKNSESVGEHNSDHTTNDVEINKILTKSKSGSKLSREEENEWQKKLKFWIKKQSNSSSKSNPKKKNEVNHICEICGRIYQTKEGLKGHEYTHTGILKYECTYCGRKFGQKKLLNGHMEVKHIKSKFFTCKICNKVFNRKNTLTKHRWAHIDIKRFKCESCGKLFRWKTCLKDHMNTHTKSIEFPCYACDKIYTSRASRRKHCIKFHNGKGLNSEAKSPEIKLT